MPYTPPGTIATSSPTERNHRRSRSFTDEPGPGPFNPLPSVPRRTSRPSTPALITIGSTSSTTDSNRPATPTRGVPKFVLHTGSSDDSDGDEDDDEKDVPLTTNALANKIVSKVSDATGHTRTASPPPVSISISIPSPIVTTPDGSSQPAQVPFPALSSPTVTAASPMQRSSSTPQISSPTMDDRPPSIYRSPHSSLRSNPNSRVSYPLKPALKSNHSSPHLPSLAHQRALTQSAPSTPNLSAWSSGSGSVPGSPGSTYSVPQTPKQVHFAADRSSMESVVVFAKGTRPRSLSNPGGNDTETETEGYDSSSGPTRYPFPVMPKPENVILIDDSRSSTIPASSAVGSNGFTANGEERRFVFLETVTLPGARPPMMRGSVLVRNVAFQKRVAVRFTLDDWQTISEVSCTYSASLPSLPPPFSSSAHSPSAHQKAASISHTPVSEPPISNGGKAETWDRFTFTIKLEDMERTLPTKNMFLVVKYQLPSQWGWESGGEWWDNNEGKNYEFGFKVGKKATAAGASDEASPSALAARTSASIQRPEFDSFSLGRTQSLPPLPPPGPVRTSPLSGSPVGLKAKPILPPVTSLPKLRSGRGPTFTDAPSPPGSPVARNSPTRTTYTPPLPGTVPGITFGIIQPPPPAPKEQPPKLTIATDLAEKVGPVPDSPIAAATFGTLGKKRLSLSNYASPTLVKSPSSMAISPMQNLSSLMSGGDGGENHYVGNNTPPKESSPSENRKSLLPSPQLRMVNGMPATVLDDPSSSTPPRIPSWDAPLSGFWNAMGVMHQTKPLSPPMPARKAEDEEKGLPTPPDSSSSTDSTLSTPDLERSPEQETAPIVEDRDTPTPTFVEQQPIQTSFVPFPRSSSPTSSEEGGATVRPGQNSPLLTPHSSDEDGVRPPELSGLGRRLSEQGMVMRLDLPVRPTFKVPSPEPVVVPMPASPVRHGSGSGSDSSTSSTASVEDAAKPKKSKKRVNGGASSPAIGLGLVTSGGGSSTSGPPPEFLAKYCFFVSSPTASPPTTTSPSPLPSSVVGSPALMQAFGTGIDTPRASSPGLASAAAQWWGYQSGPHPDRIVGAGSV